MVKTGPSLEEMSLSLEEQRRSYVAIRSARSLILSRRHGSRDWIHAAPVHGKNAVFAITQSPIIADPRPTLPKLSLVMSYLRRRLQCNICTRTLC